VAPSIIREYSFESFIQSHNNTAQIKYRVECRFVKDTLKGDDVNEIRVELKQMVEESFGDDYNDG